MADATDFQLLQEYAHKGSEAAFQSLIDRYLNLVYSVARSRLANEAAAKDITQIVFAALASRAGRLSEKSILSGWLFQLTNHACQDLKRAEARRKKWEGEAMQQQIIESNPGSFEMNIAAPLINTALASLAEAERDAILLRFFEEQGFGEVGARLGITEAAAKMRVSRGLEKLRRLLQRRGVTVSEATLCGALPQMIHCAPASLGAAIKTGAAAHAALSTSNNALLNGLLKTMAWTKIKTVMVVGVAVILATGMTDLALKHYRQAHQLMPAAADSGESSKQRLQGHWTGSNTAHPGQTCTLNISGDQIAYRGADPNDWLRGKFALNENANPQQMNVTILEPANGFFLGIYQVNGDKIIIAAAEHGNNRRPVNFAPSRQVDVLELQRD